MPPAAEGRVGALRTTRGIGGADRPRRDAAPHPRRGARRALSPRNIEENRVAWLRFVRWATSHGIRHLDDVTSAHAAKYSRWLIEAEGLTPGRHNKLLTIAGVMCRLAGRPDPFASVTRYQVRHESRSHLELQQIKDLLAKAQGEHRTLLLIGLYTGLRLGDAATLEWGKHVDLARGMIHRIAAKTGRPVTFPIHPALARALAPGGTAGPVLPGIARQYQTHRTTLCVQLRKVFERAGLATVEGSHATYTLTGKKRKAGEKPAVGRTLGISRYGYHSLRHTFVTLCARAGVPIGLVRDWVGHASESVTRIYEHWGPSERGRIIQALPDVDLTSSRSGA